MSSYGNGIIGNEVSEPAKEKGVELAKEMVELFHALRLAKTHGMIGAICPKWEKQFAAVYKRQYDRKRAAFFVS